MNNKNDPIYFDDVFNTEDIFLEKIEYYIK